LSDWHSYRNSLEPYAILGTPVTPKRPENTLNMPAKRQVCRPGRAVYSRP
jgi:hypothetical protein